MRVAVIGAGQIGRAHSLRLAALPEVTHLEIAYRQGAEKAQAIAKEITDPQRPNYRRDLKVTVVQVEEVIAQRPAAAVITAQTSAHAELIQRCLANGIPVYCEKPVALDLPTTKAVVEAWKKAQVPVQIGFQRRFDQGYLAAKAAYQSGRLGKVALLNALTLDECPPPEHFVPTSGGLFLDVSVHDFDIIRWVTGLEATWVYAQGATMGEPYFAANNDLSSAQILVKYENAMTATISLTRRHGAGHDVRLELFGEQDSLCVGLDDRSPLRTAQPAETLNWLPKEPYHSYNERFDQAFYDGLKHFLAVAQGRAESACTPEDALISLQLALAAQRSIDWGRPVALSELTDQ